MSTFAYSAVVFSQFTDVTLRADAARITVTVGLIPEPYTLALGAATETRRRGPAASR